MTFEDAMSWAGVRDGLVPKGTLDAFRADGYAILRGAIAADDLVPLRTAFERGVTDNWPFPREHGTRFAMLSAEPQVRRVCLLPAVLLAVAHIMERPFYLCDVQGRDPRPGGGGQTLHRDWLEPGLPTMLVSGFAFLDDFDEGNGATRVVPGTHRGNGNEAEIVLSGGAGDILLLDAHLIHSATRNVSGRLRRSIHMVFRAQEHTVRRQTEWDLTDTCAQERCLLGYAP